MDRPQRLIIIGSQGHAKAVAEVANAISGIEIVGFVDDFRPAGTPVLQWQVLGSTTDIISVTERTFDVAFIAIGDNDSRLAMVDRLKPLELCYRTLCHPTAYLSPSAKLGNGTVLMPHSVVSVESQLGAHVIVNTSASIDHDCIVEAFCSIAPGAHLAGHVTLRTAVAIGMGANVREKTEVKAHTIVGAGATVLCDLADFLVAYGTPAKEIRKRKLGEKYLR